MSPTWTTCPYCGERCDAHAEVADPAAQPRDGDCSVCFGCGEVAVYFAITPSVLALRQPTQDERRELLADPDVRRARAAIAESYSGQQAVRLVRGQ